MGYRSDIAIGIKADSIKKIRMLNLLRKEGFPKVLTEDDCEEYMHEFSYVKPEKDRISEHDYTITKQEKVLYWAFEGWKWYEGYSEVDEVMKFLSDLGEENYGFIRVGEETADIEELGTPWEFGIEIDRTILTPVLGSE